MSEFTLKDFAVMLGFKVDEAGAKKQQDVLAKTERAVDSLEKAERDAHEAGARRAAEMARRAESMAATARLATAGLVAFAATATAAVTALAVHLQKSLGEFDRLYYVAGRTGTAVNNIKAIGYAFEQTGSSAGRAMQMLESFAKARRMNPGVDAMLKNYGVDTKGDASDVLGNGIDAIRKRHPHFSGAQVAGILGVSEEDYEHWNRTRPERERFTREYKALQKTLGVNGNEVASNAAKISQAYGSFTAVIEVLGQKITQTFAPAIERVVKGFRDWIEANSDKLVSIMQSLAKALEWVGDKLIVLSDWTVNGGKLFGDFWLKTYGYIEKIVDVVKVLIDYLLKLNASMMAGPVGKYMDFMFGGGLAGKLLGSSAQAAEGGGGGGIVQASANDNGGSKPGLIRRGWNAVKRGLGLGGGGGGAETNYPAGSKHPILDLITRAEGTKRGYDDSFAHQVGGSLTDKTLDEVQGIQKGMRGSSAIGKYQFMRATLNGLRKEMGLRGDEKFDPAMQDRLALRLYERRMAQARRKGGGDGAVLEALAQEWASFPTSSGSGYYPGQRAAVSTHQVLDAVRRQEASKTEQRSAAAGFPAFGSKGSFGTGFNPGSFDVNAMTRAAPMGSSSVSNQSSMSVHSPTNVTIHGFSDPQKAAEHFERAANRSNDRMLENVQAAAR